MPSFMHCHYPAEAYEIGIAFYLLAQHQVLLLYALQPHPEVPLKKASTQDTVSMPP